MNSLAKLQIISKTKLPISLTATKSPSFSRNVPLCDSIFLNTVATFLLKSALFYKQALLVTRIYNDIFQAKKTLAPRENL